MTIEECYQRMEGNYDEVSRRLPSLRLIEKFVGKFLDDKSFEELCIQMENGNRAEAFRAAHTLKGVCANLSFTKLMNSASQLTEELRPEADEIPAAAADLMAAIRRDYEMTVDAIRSYLN